MTGSIRLVRYQRAVHLRSRACFRCGALALLVLLTPLSLAGNAATRGGAMASSSESVVAIQPLEQEGSLANIDLLHEIAHHISEAKRFSCTFSQTRRIEQLPLPLLSSGALEYRQGGGVKWHTQKPIDSMLRISSAGQMFNNGVEVSGTSILAELLLDLFSGDWHSLQEHFTINIRGALSAWEMTLTPRSKAMASQISSVSLAGSGYIERLVMQEVSGDSTDISFQLAEVVGAASSSPEID